MVPWHEIETVLLDMDGTLFDLRYDNYLWKEHIPLRYSEKHNISLAKAKAYCYEHFKANEGTMNWYRLDYWEEMLGLDILALKREVKHLIRTRPFVKEFMQWLGSEHYRVLLVTNAHRHSIELKFAHYDLSPYLDGIVSSHDYLLPKEDQAFWQTMQKEKSFNPELSVFFDDNQSVLNAAKTFGIKHCVGITQPDLEQSPKSFDDFFNLECFSEITPTLKHAGS